LGIFLCSTIGRIPGDRTSRSLDANLAIPTRVLRFEASRRARISSPPARASILGFLSQPCNPTGFVVNCRKPRLQTSVVRRYPAPAPIDDFILLFLPPYGPHLTPLPTGSLESGLLVSPLLGGPARHRPFAPALHLHQRKSNRNLHLQYSTKSQSTPRCQSLITAMSDHPPVLGRSRPQSPT
jgi:hypothetical protein